MVGHSFKLIDFQHHIMSMSLYSQLAFYLTRFPALAATYPGGGLNNNLTS